MRYSLAHLTILSHSPPELVRIAARCGYDYVSLRPIYMGLPNEPNYALAANPGLLAETRAALAETGLGVHDIELARVNDETDPRRYLPAFEVAAALGCRNVISSVWTPRRGFALDRFREICALARPLGLTVNLEFMLFSELKTLQDALAFLREAGADNAKLLVDTLHFHCSGGKPEDLDAVPRELFGFVHLCDGPRAVPQTKEGLTYLARSVRLYPGDGGVDLAGIVNRMPEMVCSIELPNYIKTEIYGREGHALRCIQAARAYFTSRPRPAAKDRNR